MVMPPVPLKVMPPLVTEIVPASSFEQETADMAPSPHWPVSVTVVALIVPIVPLKDLMESVPRLVTRETSRLPLKELMESVPRLLTREQSRLPVRLVTRLMSMLPVMLAMLIALHCATESEPARELTFKVLTLAARI